MIQTVSALAIVLASIVLLRVLLRAGGLAPHLGGRRSLRVVETVALGTRQRIHVVEVDGDRFLVGSTEGAVRLLRRLEPAENAEPAEQREECPPRASRWPSGGRDWLRLLGRTAVLVLVLVGLGASNARAVTPETAATAPQLTLSIDGLAEPERVSSTLQIIALITLVSVAPSILLMATCFTRILVVMALIRQAVGIHQLPPNQVLVGLALFTTLFVMAPVGREIHEQALVPYMEREIDHQVAVQRTLSPVRSFLLTHTREKDLELFVSMSGQAPPETLEEVSLPSLLPAFMISELRAAFEIGFMIYLPFLVIDIVIASMLISMGMIVLPPIMISLPFKLMLFVLLDGWNLVLSSLVASVR